ncbi:MAG: DUF2029 domain-containing protein [Alicyclobacillus sp.]|nr:DUF2029 domain-containing protein [Alicyclobacillus sp.]
MFTFDKAYYRTKLPGLFRLVSILIFLAALAVFLVRFFPVYAGAPPDRPDFDWYYDAFNLIWNYGNLRTSLYDPYIQHMGMVAIGVNNYDPLDFYGYPPQFAILWSWLAAFDLPTAKGLWTLMAVLAYVGAFILLLRMAAPNARYEIYLLLLASVLFSFPLYQDLYWGQANSFIFLAMVGAFYLYWKNRWPWVAGLLLGVAVVFKLTPAFALLVFLLRRQWRMLMGCVVWIVLSTVASAFILGWGTLWQFVKVLPSFNAQNMQHGPAPWNSSFAGVLTAWEAPSYYSKGVSATFVHQMNVLWMAGFVVLVGVTLLRCRSVDKRWDVALAALCSLLLSPLIEDHHMILAWIPFLLLFAHVWEGRYEQWVLTNAPFYLRPADLQPVKLSSLLLTFEARGCLTLLLALVLASGKPFGDDYFVALLLLLIAVVEHLWSSGRVDDALVGR